MAENLHEAGSHPAAVGPAPPVEETPRRGPWGFWPTLGLSLVIVMAYTAAQVAVAAAFTVPAVIRDRDIDIEAFAEELMHTGLFWSAAICAAAPITIGLTLLCAAARRGIATGDYLALRRPGGRTIAMWCLIQLAFIACTDGATYLIRGRIVPAFMVDVYRTAQFVPLLWFALVLVAPVTEELLIRGFLFRGIERSRLGPAGAIVLSALGWAALHTQYDLFGIFTIVLGGLLLGYARLRSQSLYVPIAMHIVQNIVATLEVMIYVSAR